ncbi:MAG: hypothetical protein ACM31M_04210 [Nitrososphaerota archaeon]|jgi:ABC-type uncharacterized transport system ATPase subunit
MLVSASLPSIEMTPYKERRDFLILMLLITQILKWKINRHKEGGKFVYQIVGLHLSLLSFTIETE